MVFARLFARSAGSLDAVAASTAAALAAAAFLGRANIAARQFIVYESVASHAARPREQPHLLGTLATLALSAPGLTLSVATRQLPSRVIRWLLELCSSDDGGLSGDLLGTDDDYRGLG